MKWFKHLTEAHDDEKLSEVLCIHGPGAYGVFWLIVESIAAQMDKTDKCHAKYHIKKWAAIAHVDRRTLARYLQTFDMLTLILYQECDNFVTLGIPNLLKLRDNYTKDLQVTTKKSSKQEVEVEVEVEKSVISKAKKKQKSTLPENFQISESIKLWAKEKDHNPTLDDLEGFVLYHSANGSKFINWDSAFMTWMRNKKKFNKDDGSPDGPRNKRLN